VTKSAADLDLVRKALDLPRPSLDELAEAVGTSTWNLKAYRAGRARMPRELRLRLAAELMARARGLEGVARILSESVASATLGRAGSEGASQVADTESVKRP